MNRFTAFLSIVALLAIAGCNDDEESSPYDEILSKPPFAELTDSIAEKPADDELYFRRAVLLNKNNIAEPALADFRKAWSINKHESYAYGISTILLDKRPDSAIIFLNEALKELPESMLLRLNLAHALDAQGKTPEALVIADEILQSNPQQVDVLIMKADLLEKKGDINQSVSTLERAYQLTPYNLQLIYILALKYAESKNPKILSLCDSLAKMDSLGIHAEPYYYKGIYFSNVNDKAKAIQQFDLAINHDYNFLDAYIEKGGILFDERKFQEAFSVFNRAMTISPKFADAYYWMAKCQEAMGDKREARLNYQRAFGLDRTLTEAKAGADRLAS